MKTNKQRTADNDKRQQTRRIRFKRQALVLLLQRLQLVQRLVQVWLVQLEPESALGLSQV
jgi:hypothetical protein